MQPLSITPAELDFDIFQPGQDLLLPVCIKVRRMRRTRATAAAAIRKLLPPHDQPSTSQRHQDTTCCPPVLAVQNLDTRPRSFRVKAPTARWFALRGIGHQHRLAPGLSITFEVCFCCPHPVCCTCCCAAVAQNTSMSLSTSSTRVSCSCHLSGQPLTNTPPASRALKSSMLPSDCGSCRWCSMAGCWTARQGRRNSMTPSGLPASQCQQRRSRPWSCGSTHGRPGQACVCRVTCSLVCWQQAHTPAGLCSCRTEAQHQLTTPSPGTGRHPAQWTGHRLPACLFERTL